MSYLLRAASALWEPKAHSVNF